MEAKGSPSQLRRLPALATAGVGHPCRHGRGIVADSHSRGERLDLPKGCAWSASWTVQTEQDLDMGEELP